MISHEEISSLVQPAIHTSHCNAYCYQNIMLVIALQASPIFEADLDFNLINPVAITTSLTSN